MLICKTVNWQEKDIWIPRSITTKGMCSTEKLSSLNGRTWKGKFNQKFNIPKFCIAHSEPGRVEKGDWFMGEWREKVEFMNFFLLRMGYLLSHTLVLYQSQPLFCHYNFIHFLLGLASLTFILHPTRWRYGNLSTSSHNKKFEGYIKTLIIVLFDTFALLFLWFCHSLPIYGYLSLLTFYEGCLSGFDV